MRHTRCNMRAHSANTAIFAGRCRSRKALGDCEANIEREFAYVRKLYWGNQVAIYCTQGKNRCSPSRRLVHKYTQNNGNEDDLSWTTLYRRLGRSLQLESPFCVINNFINEVCTSYEYYKKNILVLYYLKVKNWCCCISAYISVMCTYSILIYIYIVFKNLFLDNIRSLSQKAKSHENHSGLR